MGVLSGVRVLEMAGLGPVPFAAMMLSDMGASVIRVNPPAKPGGVHPQEGPLWRGRGFVELDLKTEAGRGRAAEMASRADVLLEGFRPGVMERLGLGPDIVMSVNPELVYGRATGWGQDGPWAQVAGHDINYLAASGVLRQICRAGQPPTPPLNLVADYGGGGMLLVTGVLAALLERSRSGKGQVVDAAMADGAMLLMTSVIGRMNAGQWSEPPGTNVIDTGAPFYEVYATSDGRWLAVGAIEPVFYARFVDGLGLADADLPPQMERESWPRLKEIFAGAVKQRTLREWAEVFADIDACVTPVLTLDEAAGSEHIQHRHLLVRDPDLGLVPAPAPRFGRTPSSLGDLDPMREGPDAGSEWWT